MPPALFDTMLPGCMVLSGSASGLSPNCALFEAASGPVFGWIRLPGCGLLFPTHLVDLMRMLR